MPTDYFADLPLPGDETAPSTPSHTPFYTPIGSDSITGSGTGTPIVSAPVSRPASRASRFSRSSRSRGGASSPVSSSPPPPLPEMPRKNSADVANDESISILDPRRFTPTLHASLVSEILSLRRELETKHKFIEDLEINLQNSKGDNDALNCKLSQSVKDQRSTKRQLQQIETGTLAALEEMAKDRDDTKKANIELKSKIETLEQKIKSQEDDTERTITLWENDKLSWDNEKRSLERRVHVTETRMKAVLEELSAQEDATQEMIADSEDEDTRDSGLGNESDTHSVRSTGFKESIKGSARHSRNMSNNSFRSVRRADQTSALGGSLDHTGEREVSLADELSFHEEDEEELEEEMEQDEIAEQELRARKARESRHHFDPDDKAKRILGISGDTKDLLARDSTDIDHYGPVGTRGRSASAEVDSSHEIATHMSMAKRPRESVRLVQVTRPSSPTEQENKMGRFSSKAEYIDSGVQFSLPPSPTLVPTSADDGKLVDESRSVTGQEHLVSRASEEILCSRCEQRLSLSSTKQGSMVSAASQTIEEPPSPPATPTVSVPSSPLEPPAPAIIVEVSSVSTQTEDSPEPEARPNGNVQLTKEIPQQPSRAPPPIPISIPSIAIHPPASAPSSPKEAILPPRTKNASSQTIFAPSAGTRSISIQTEEIRVDLRSHKLPPHLLPSAIKSTPNTPNTPRSLAKSLKSPRSDKSLTKSEKALGKSPVRGGYDDIPSSPPVLISGTDDFYPPNNDNGPLTRASEDILRRPQRTSSLFAGFDGKLSDDEQEFYEEDGSDDDQLKTPLPTLGYYSRHLKGGRVFGKPPTPVPEDKETDSPDRVPDVSEQPAPRSPPKRSGRASVENNRVTKPLRGSGVTRQASVRRSALVSSGMAAHRSRSPSMTSVGSSNLSSVAAPPFPVPTRSSSRRVQGLSKSEGSQSPTPRGTGLFGSRRAQTGRQISRADSLRKVRSAAAIPRRGRPQSRSGSRSPTKMDRRNAPPPLPRDVIESSNLVVNAHRADPKSLIVPSTSHSHSGRQQTSVVDAIAATMVGEWMWKYVRRRKSFGVPETPQDLNKSAEEIGQGTRHKRWVWLSPYERCVMWSSKQPTSGSALMGKSGRKLVIQSVLDVKDDSPAPKGSGSSPPFGRSILILTPARALKFTANSSERHYLWLTALSFLAQSTGSVGAPELTTVPATTASAGRSEATDNRKRSSSLRRLPARDLARLAKERVPPLPLPLQTSYSASNTQNHSLHDYKNDSRIDLHSPLSDAADAPIIPRYASHGRKRSHTGPRIPPAPASLRSYSHNHVPVAPPASYSASGPYSPSVDLFGLGGAGMGSASGSGMSTPVVSPRGWETRDGALGRGSVVGNSSRATSERNSESATSAGAVGAGNANFFDAMGTVRMEAFVENRRSEESGIGVAVGGGAGKGVGRIMGRKRGNSQWSGSGSDPRRSGIVVGDEFDPLDPFKGF
ncbi:hypothetical protein K402DRAFT_99564 [Aulographum hederae CBS 113979]|uniref:Pleckstrin homology domain-containing protein n=1 Tax=Aulographum hederae CBS 113979 TaxID=1176131 RepID=A0A6G1GXP5_9PEZI|nr:hypothetical protein K402DRAFT_99564 [Aulographum hederae CBS 113979]